MRKTSQDGGDTISATSGVENEIKKPKSGLLEFKSKKLGKRTAPNLSEESDDAVVEPLLQKNTNTTTQSAKYFAKAKADTVKEISKLFNDKKSQYASTSGFGTTETLLSEKDSTASKPNSSSNAPLHNYMNTNVFHSHDSSKANGTTKSQTLVEIDGSKQSGYSPSPLIFTTAKIHTDGKSKHMEPVQMTPAPISSTVEVSMSKKGNITTNEKKVSNGTSVMNTIYPEQMLNEKTINISNANITPTTQLKDNQSKTSVSNLSKSVIAKSPTENISQPKENIINSEKAPVLQSKLTSNKTEFSSKSITTVTNDHSEIRSPPVLSKTISPATLNEKLGKIKDPKVLVDEPRIVMSESKLKSTITDTMKASVSAKATKSPLDNKDIESTSIKQPQISEPNDNEKVKSENNHKSLDHDIITKSIDNKDSQPLLMKNVKSPTASKEFTNKSDPNAIKRLHEQKSKAETGSSSSKTELKMDVSSSKIPEFSKDPSAKTLSSFTKPSMQSKADSKISKEIVKSPKPSANESKVNTKISLNDSATSSSNKIPSSIGVAKSASSVSSSNVVRTNTSDTSKKSLNNSSLSDSKATTASVVSTTLPPSIIKTQSTSTKTATTTVNTKPVIVTSAKSSIKTSLSSSIKPQTTSTTSTTSAAKQPITSTAKTTISKPPSLASTKTPQVNISHTVTAATAKPIASKIAQASTNKPALNTSSSSKTSTTIAVEATHNKTKALESNKKPGSKPSDSKVSKALH